MSERADQRVRASIARDSFADTLNRVAYRGERIVLERHGKPVAALVSLDDLDLLERLEDEADVQAVAKARRERGSVPHDELRRKAGLKRRRG
jgi:prevent-host-death family protein